MAARTSDPLPLTALVVWGVVAPCGLAIVTYSALARLQHTAWRFEVVPIYLLFIAEVALLGYGVARGIPHRGWRWLIFGWLLLLLNLLLFSHGSLANWRAAVVLRALWAAQVSALIVWAVLGDWPKFYWRYPLAALVALPVIVQSLGGERWLAWSDVVYRISMQWLFLLLIALLLRRLGYRVLRMEAEAGAGRGGAEAAHAQGAGAREAGVDGVDAADPAELRPNQFGVRHLLIWMTSISLLLAVCKALDLFRMLYLQGAALGASLDIIMAGAFMCLVLISALWAALGQGRFWLRWGVCLGFTPAIGLVMESWDRWATRAGPATPWNLVWTVWMSLAAAMLVALLAILRGEGHRLARQQGTCSPAVAAEASPVTRGLFV